MKPKMPLDHLDELEAKAKAGERISDDEALWVIRWARSMYVERPKPTEQQKDEAIAQLIEEAKHQGNLMQLSDRELADLVSATWLPRISVLGSEHTILDQLCMRLERANNGPVTDAELDELMCRLNSEQDDN